MYFKDWLEKEEKRNVALCEKYLRKYGEDDRESWLILKNFRELFPVTRDIHDFEILDEKDYPLHEVSLIGDIAPDHIKLIVRKGPSEFDGIEIHGIRQPKSQSREWIIRITEDFETVEEEFSEFSGLIAFLNDYLEKNQIRD